MANSVTSLDLRMSVADKTTLQLYADHKGLNITEVIEECLERISRKVLKGGK